jgi:hypothetical protein
MSEEYRMGVTTRINFFYLRVREAGLLYFLSH